MFGGVGLLAAVVLVIELFVRAGLIYIVVALSPLIYAAAVWEQLRGGVRKLAELGLALIISKFVIAVALSLSAAALVAAWPGEDGTEIATPELAASTGGGAGAGVAHTVGLLVGAVVMFGIAAFMPFVLFRLLPIAEAALVSQGIKAGPMRAAQQAHHTALIARHNPATAATRRHRGARPPPLPAVARGAAGPARAQRGGGASAGAGGAAGSAGAGAAAGAAAGPAGAVVGAAAAGAKTAARSGARRTAAAADRATSASSSSSPSASSSSGGFFPQGRGSPGALGRRPVVPRPAGDGGPPRRPGGEQR